MLAAGMRVLVAGVCGVVLSGCGSSDPVVPPDAVQKAWDNHFEAFGAGVAAGMTDGADKTAALDKIMLDYDEMSTVRVFNDETEENSTYEGIAPIRGMFDQLFTDLDGCSGEDADQLQAPLAQVEEDPFGQVFLVWRCQKARFNYATDTFIFEGAKIRAQNIVVSVPAMAKTRADSKVSVTAARRLTEYNPMSVQEAWDNHFAAFGGQDLDMIMLDYEETSVVSTFEWKNQTAQKHTGLAAIRSMFSALFDVLVDPNDVMAPLVTVVDEANERQVFLVWNSRGNGILKATDTFIFGSDNKIKKQNIVTVSS